MVQIEQNVYKKIIHLENNLFCSFINFLKQFLNDVLLKSKKLLRNFTE